AGVAAVGRTRDVALQGEQQSAALTSVPGEVADVVEALRREVRRKRARLAGLLDQAAVGAVEAHRDPVEEPRPGGRVRQALEVGERHAVGLSQAPAPGA